MWNTAGLRGGSALESVGISTTVYPQWIYTCQASEAGWPVNGVTGNWSTHRFRNPAERRFLAVTALWIDLNGDGKKVLLVAPMIGLKATQPDYADNVPVYLYRPGEWNRELFTDLPPREMTRGCSPNPINNRTFVCDLLFLRWWLSAVCSRPA